MERCGTISLTLILLAHKTHGGHLMAGFLKVNTSELQNLKVEDKFKKVFNKIIIGAMVAVVALTITIAFSVNGILSMYNSYLADNVQGEIRIDIQALSKAFL